MLFMRRTGQDPGDSRKEYNMENKRIKTRSLTGVAVLTAIVVVLQFLGSFIRFGPFSISLVLIPIVVGAALYGHWAGAWLGFAFGMIVLLSGDAGPFLAVSPLGTILTVLVKGAAAGFLAGLVYRALSRFDARFVLMIGGKEKWDVDLAVIVSAIVCPVVNTGIFLLGCLIFFLPTVTEWGTAMGFPSVGKYMIFGLVGGNFLFELLVNVVLSPVIVRLIKAGRASNSENRWVG